MEGQVFRFYLLFLGISLLSCESKYHRIENSIKHLSISEPEIAILKWRIVGPFVDTAHASTFLSFSTPLEPLSSKRIGAGIEDTLYTHRKGHIVDFDELYGSTEKQVAYALSVIKAREQGEVAFLIGTTDDVRLWVNDKLCLATSALPEPKKTRFIKKIYLEKGDNFVVVEIANTDRGKWGFNMDVATIDHVRYNALEPNYYNSCLNPTIALNDSLHIHVSNPEFIPVTKPCLLEIYDLDEKLVLRNRIQLDKEANVCLEKLTQGVYKYNLYTDLDTLHGVFSYGSIDQLYNRNELIKKCQGDSIRLRVMVPYMKRLDHLLKVTQARNRINHDLSKKIAFCLYRIRKIDHEADIGEDDIRKTTGLQLRTFRSAIDSADDYYQLYIPEKSKHEPDVGMPLVVMVPYVTNRHEFYYGSIVANTPRNEYIASFAEQHGMAVVWPSSRIYTRYNMTPIVTKAIEETLADVFKFYNIDRQNIFFYGNCSGGLFALSAVIQKPELCSAIALEGPDFVPAYFANGGYDPSIIANDIFGLTDNLADKPMMILHSKYDAKAPVQLSAMLIDSLKKKGQRVKYDDLRDASKKSATKKMMAESQAMRKVFDFFHLQLKAKERPLKLKRFVSYAVYRDTVYGVLIKEKISSGKASFEYSISDNVLKMETHNIRSFCMDTKGLDIPDIRELRVVLNGRALKPIDMVIRNDLWEATMPVPRRQSKGTGYENYIPLNAIFKQHFAVVRPESADTVVDSILHAIRSVWRDEYFKDIRIIDEAEIQRALDANTNLIYIDNAGLDCIPDSIASAMGLSYDGDAIGFKGKSYNANNISYAFVSDNKTEGPRSLTIGTTSNMISREFLQEIIQRGWLPFMVWNNRSGHSLIDVNYRY
ncbi:alpha/beta hydrolase family protein [Parapedobacter tibetensis]|uniref:alpha/beta hydrolase family protein n=1 Tax=Parapedobacter tibetensis TaxID=2972951 RepID=UPI00214D4577|nr:hypothetical protein [Parapedobacter tibetensis]